MKKRVLALLFGGVIAVGSLALQGSITAQVDEDAYLGTSGWEEWRAEVNCTGCSDAHISSSQITAGGGQLKVAVGISYAAEDTPALIEGICGGAVYLCEQPWTPENGVGDGNTYYNFENFYYTANTMKYFNEGVTVNGITELTFDGLKDGQTYYVYCQVYDVHGRETDYGEHYAVCLGTGTPTAGGENFTVPVTEDTSAADSSIADTSATEISATETSAASTVYVVRPGDTMSRIARTNHMTLAELAAKNPQIKNLNKIWGGQQINL